LRAAEGDSADELLVGLALGCPGDFGEPFIDGDPHDRADDAGAVGVDGDAGAGVFLGRRLGEGAGREILEAQ
jgi:hypothetical protein